MTTQAQQEILENIEKSGKKPKDAKAKPAIPDGPRRYVSNPGYQIVGLPAFPFETDDPDVQAEVERSRGFKRGKIWIEMRTQEEREATESSLDKMPVVKLRVMVKALGYKNINSYKKYELLDILMKEGFN
ncbi:MAG: hypothetical protein ACYTAS_02230 [Planctomycetota bacterium]|jgi:hypothetical protein